MKVVRAAVIATGKTNDAKRGKLRVTDNKSRVKVWRLNSCGERMWAVLTDMRSKHFPVIWVRDEDDATDFSGGEANTILKRYPETVCGYIPIGEQAHAA